MANETIDDVIAKMAENTTLVGSLNAYTSGLRQQVKDALANNPAQSKVDALFAAAESNGKGIAAAMVENVVDLPPPVDPLNPARKR